MLCVSESRYFQKSKISVLLFFISRVVNRVGFFLHICQHICIVPKHSCIIIKNILFENKKFQLKLILLENFPNLIEKTCLNSCIYIYKIHKLKRN
jgi:hypothetical protein